MSNVDLNYFDGERSEMRPLLPSTYSRVLEVGCGTGAFRRGLKEDCEYWGVEGHSSAAQMAARRLDKVLAGTFQSLAHDIPNEYFDLVICNDVIEHMPDHDVALRMIREKLVTNGYLVASIPNVRFLPNLYDLLVRKDWRYRSTGILDTTHLRFFTEKSIKRALSENGFSTEQMIGLNPMASGRTSKRRVLKAIGLFAASKFLGDDVRYLQFGVRARKSPLSGIATR